LYISSSEGCRVYELLARMELEIQTEARLLDLKEND